MGTLADRYGVAVTSAIGAVALGLGYVGAAYAGSIWQFALIQGVLIGFLGASATFAPLVADTSHWFVRRRGIAVAICASGNYLSGTLWPPVLQHFVESAGWRPTHVGIGLFCVATLLPLSLAFRRQPAGKARARAAAGAGRGAPGLADARAGAPHRRRLCLLRRDVDAAGAHRRLLRRPRLRRRPRHRDAVDHARPRHRQPARLGLSRRPHRRACDGARRLRSPGAVARALSLLRRARLALRDLGDLRPRPGRHHPKLRDRHPRGLSGPRGGLAGRRRHHGDDLRHGLRRLDLGRDLRPHRLLPGRVPARHRLERGELRDRVVAAAALAARASAGSRPGR